MAQRTPRNRSFCFTINNIEDTTEQQLNAVECRYMIFGREVAPTTGQRHLQGFVTFKNALGLQTVKEKLPFGAHVEVAKGSAAQNKAYCSKGGEFQERGEIPSPGKRTDLDVAIDLALSSGLNAVAEQHPKAWVLHSKGLKELVNTKREGLLGRRSHKRTCLWLWGPSGAGKTKWIYDNFDAKQIWTDSGSKDFYDGYDGQVCAILDDLDTQTKNFKDLLRLSDPWHNPTLNAKGTRCVFTADYVVVTTTLSIDRFMSDRPHEDGMQLHRRFTELHIVAGREPPTLLEYMTPNPEDDEPFQAFPEAQEDLNSLQL